LPVRAGGTVAIMGTAAHVCACAAALLGSAAAQCVDDGAWRFNGLTCATFVGVGGPGAASCGAAWASGVAGDGSAQTAYEACQVTCSNTECALPPCRDDAAWRFNGLTCATFVGVGGPGVASCGAAWASGVARDGSAQTAYEACQVACGNVDTCEPGPPALGFLPPQTCEDFGDLQAWLEPVNVQCCDDPAEDCSSGAPATCDEECARFLLPFQASVRTSLAWQPPYA
jgi:hypothetical protein